jgi:hypothetical protein
MRRLLAASVVVTVAMVALSALGAGAATDTTTTTAKAVAGSADASGTTDPLPAFRAVRGVPCGTPGGLKDNYPGRPCGLPFGPNLLGARPFLFAVRVPRPKVPFRTYPKPSAGEKWVEVLPSAQTQRAMTMASSHLGGEFRFLLNGRFLPGALFDEPESPIIYLVEPNARAARNLIASVCQDGCHKPIPAPGSK